MRNFGMYMVIGSFLLFLVAPVWGYICRDIADHYDLKWVYGFYLTMLPWMIHWIIGTVWLIKIMPKDAE